MLEPTKLTESEKAQIKRKHLEAEQSILDDVISEIYSSEKEYTEEDFPIKLDDVFEYPEELDCIRILFCYYPKITFICFQKQIIKRLLS